MTAAVPACRRDGDRARGSATVEFALVLPMLLVVVLAMLEIGLLVKDQLAVVQAARGGAREAAVTLDDEAVRTAAIEAGAVLDPERTEVVVERSGGAGEPVSVRVAYEATVDVPLVGWLFPDRIELTSSTTMRQEVDEEPPP